MLELIDLTPLFEAAIVILAALAARYLIPWLKEKYSAEQLEGARRIAEVVVYAAEKLYGSGEGAKKLSYAIATMEKDFGVTISTKQLRAVIEAAVRQMEQAEPVVVELNEKG